MIKDSEAHPHGDNPQEDDIFDTINFYTHFTAKYEPESDVDVITKQQNGQKP
jgi:hypothetical protein